MGNVKFALDTGPDATSSSWLKYVRSAPSFEEQNLAACHLTGDQVSDGTAMSWLDIETLTRLTLHDEPVMSVKNFDLHQ